jgi:hypothetical protein
MRDWRRIVMAKAKSERLYLPEKNERRRAFLEALLLASNLRFFILGLSIVAGVSIYVCSTRYSKSERFSYAFDHWTGREVTRELPSPPKQPENAPSMPVLNSFEEKLVKVEPVWALGIS